MLLYRWITDSAFGDVYAVDVVFGIHEVRTAEWLGIKLVRLFTFSMHIVRLSSRTASRHLQHSDCIALQTYVVPAATERSNVEVDVDLGLLYS